MDTEIDIRTAHIEALRGEARYLSVAGIILLAVAFPVTLAFVALALADGAGASMLLPIVVGAPPIVIGYMACHYASRRLRKACQLAA
jgi:hypothetical protein